MLSTKLQTILNNRIRYLPEITGRAISSVDWPTKIIEVGHKHGLHMDEIEELQEVVLKSMTGLASPADFETNLISATAASPATIEKIIEELNMHIFEPIHQFVMNDGKAPDPLASQGIHIESEIPEAQTMPVPEPYSPATNYSTGELTIPEVRTAPKPQTIKPQVSGNHDSFFITTPTKTDHSMIK